MPAAAVDASVPIHLAGIGRLELLKDLYHHVLMAPEVRREVVQEGEGRASALQVETATQAGWMEVLPAKSTPSALLDHLLDPGEAGTIALASSFKDSVALLDDREARSIASALGIRVTGTSGVLLRAHNAGLITSLEDEVKRLEESGFWLSPRLRLAVLEAGKKRDGRSAGKDAAGKSSGAP